MICGKGVPTAAGIFIVPPKYTPAIAAAARDPERASWPFVESEPTGQTVVQRKQSIHSPDLTLKWQSVSELTSMFIGHLTEQRPQLTQDNLLFLILKKREPDTREKTPPIGQKYLQNTRSENREAMMISTRSRPPNVKRCEKVVQFFTAE